ncbi:MAG: choice-of-anchor D domain-containing protein [Deltaproteobacteria bacterium]|nr:choice-of-anchor D domain-containing protein [Deltaproteobacteria bacterium]
MRFSAVALTVAFFGLACSDAEQPASLNPTLDASTVLCAEGCPEGMRCNGGVCEPASAPDAGVLRGQAVVEPSEINFGAFSLGVAVEVTLVVSNRGSGELQVLAMEIESNAQGELEVVLGEALPRTLASGDSVAARIRYKASDGIEDHDRLRVITDDPERPIVVVPLIAEYKGVADVRVSATLGGPPLASVDLGSVSTGTERTVRVLLANAGTGNSLLEVTSADVVPGRVFSVGTAPALPALLNRTRPEVACGTAAECPSPAVSCTDGVCLDGAGVPLDHVALDVKFRPAQASAYEETLELESSDPDGSPLIVRLLGRGIEAALTVSPDPIDLGDIFVGYPKSLEVTVGNAGTDVLRISAIELVDASLVELSAPSLPLEITPSTQLPLSLSAPATSAGKIAGTLRITASGSTRDVPIFGRVQPPPRVVTSTGSVDFAEVHVFRTPGSETRTITVRNEGGSPLIFSAVGLAASSSSDFALAPGAPAQLLPGESAELTITYSPMAIGPDAGSLELVTNDPARALAAVTLRGEGTDPTAFLFKSTIPPLPASPIDFGPVYRGALPEPITLSVQNTGTGHLLLSDVRLTLGSSPDFVVEVPALPRSLSQGETIEVVVRYSPAVVGSDTGAIQILSNDRDSSPQTVAVTGSGTNCLVPNTWDEDEDPSNGCEYFCVYASSVERCNSADDDCNGDFDEGFGLGDPCDGQGQCGAGVLECSTSDNTRSVCSTERDQSADQSVAESCNELDDDCDGRLDNGFDLLTDRVNCGECGIACTASNGTPECFGGQCRVAACAAPFDDCNRVYADGCEANLLTDVGTCGTCDIVCAVSHGTPACASGSCRVATCDDGFFDCNGQYPDGCEANLVSDIATCGSCTTVCSVSHGAPVCNARVCGIGGCVEPWDDCNSAYVDGCETNTDSTPSHCGGCGNPCSVTNGSPACVAGLCEIATCVAPFDDCNTTYADGCETNTRTTVNHCGACGQPCLTPNGTPACLAGDCEIAACSAPFDDCNTVVADGCESDLSSSVLTCGSCTISCVVSNGTPACLVGQCAVAACNFPFDDCDNLYTTGCEANTSSSLSHCGGCDQPCAVANGQPTCNAGSCEISSCTAPFDDCNDSPADGCETNLQTSSGHCGVCGRVCNLANATSSCAAGTCEVDACTAPYDDCNGLAVDGCESNLSSDLATCGACNTPCALEFASEACVLGACTFLACEAGHVNLDGFAGNGCEYACTAVPGIDVPDTAFVDTNCDGIDGEKNLSIFVSPLGSDGSSGFFGSPVRTISRGIAAAQSSGRAVILVAAGLYDGTVTVANGVSIYGGYDPTTWARSYANVSLVTVSGGTAHAIGMRVENVTLPTTIDGLWVTVTANTVASGSNYGVYVRNSNASVTLRRLTVSIGTAGAGANGSGGSVGATGSAGSIGLTGCDGCSNDGLGGSGGTSACGRTGGRGGDGGYDNANGAGGATAPSGGGGGNGGLGAEVCNSGSCSSCGGRKGGGFGVAGSSGSSGSTGSNGSGGAAFGSLLSGLYSASTGGAGASGADGTGGGGGGAGGGGADDCFEDLFVCVDIGNPCNSDRGGGGGGGGAGGCGGTAGTAGQGGGGAFGMFVLDSSPRISTVTLNVGRGGAGGSGGAGASGGAGGAGGAGGFGPDDGGDGAVGGVGGAGGRGGHAGGGGGGPSLGVYRAGTSNPTIDADNIITVTGGGAGGASSGNPGATGTSATIL